MFGFDRRDVLLIAIIILCHFVGYYIIHKNLNNVYFEIETQKEVMKYNTLTNFKIIEILSTRK